MRESLDLPNIPEYVTIKDAAKLLGVSDKRVYAYIEDGRLPAMRAAHVIMIPLEEVKKFKPKISGRPRKNTPLWRTSPQDNRQLTTSIRVHTYSDLPCLLTEFRDHQVEWEEILPDAPRSRLNPLQCGMYLWPLQRVKQHIGGTLLVRTPFS